MSYLAIKLHQQGDISAFMSCTNFNLTISKPLNLQKKIQVSMVSWQH